MKTKFVKGDWNMISDRNGFKYKASEMRKEWNGLWVHKSEFEIRQPQDFVKGVKDDQSVSYVRSRPIDEEVDTSGWVDTTDDVPPGTNNGDL